MTVRQMQLLLLYLDYDPGIADGIDGPKTQAARKAFEADYDADVSQLPAAVAGAISPKGKESTDFWAEIRYVPRQEWGCPCGRCGGFPAEPEEKLVRILDELRAHFGKPVIISSGVRCAQHNGELPGSVYNSRHLSGKAVDFCVRGLTAANVKVYCDKLVSQGKLRYCYCIDGSFLHMDVA